MGGGGSSGDGTVRYAPYVEIKHQNFLNVSEAAGTTARANNPYTAYIDLNFEDAFYGSGNTISSFQSLYSMFSEYISGVDVLSLWDNVLGSVQNDTAISNVVDAHIDQVDEDFEQNILPQLLVGQRDINSVMSDSFIVAKAQLLQSKQKKIAEFDANLRYKLIPVAADVFSKYLTWNNQVVKTYIDVMKFAILTEIDQDSINYDYALREVMWPFTVLEQERANIGALQGAVTSKAGEPSTGQKVLGGAASGAAMGSVIPGVGTVAGGVVGGLAGLFL